MKKKSMNGKYLYWYVLRKAFLAMKLTALILLITSFSLMAGQSYSQEKRISLNMKDVLIKNVLLTIENSSEYFFIYNSQLVDVNRKISINVDNESISEVLRDIFHGQKVDIQVSDRKIIIAPTETATEQDQKPVSGKVTDSTGASLPGVSVVVKGTTNGTITNGDGNFSLLSVPSNAVLQFSFVGMKSIEISVAGKTTINAILTEEAIGIDEVVAVGYGVQKRLTVTGSLVDVKSAQLLKAPATNLTNTLQGHLPGLIAPNRSGEPGRDEAVLLIRGKSTTGDSNPLIIVDGVERSEYASTNTTKRSGLGQLDANDIESITVLKDASASIYGARAANGVILVTTKRGATGKPTFNVSFNQGFNEVTRTPDVLDAALYATTVNEADVRNGKTTLTYSDDDIQKYTDGSDPIGHPNTDWVKETLKPWSLQRKMNLSVNGGNEKLRYFMSISSQGQDGNFRNNPTNYQLYGIRSNVDAFITDNLTVSLNIAGRYEKKIYPSTDTWTNFVNILSAMPTLIAKYPNGLIAPGRLGENPLLRDQVGYDRTENLPMTSTLSVKYAIPFIKGLDISASYNFDVRNQFNKLFKKPFYYYVYNTTTDTYTKTKATNITTPSVADRFDRWFVTTYNVKANYARTFGKHNVGLLLGWEQSQSRWNYTYAYRQNFTSSTLPEISLGGSGASDQATAGNSSKDARNNYFGRLNYNFNERYLVEALFRYDGSYIFPAGKRYGFFPGISVGWRASEENFIKDNVAFINNLKFRASYGTSGNDRVDPYQYAVTYSLGDNYTFGNTDVSGLVLNTMPNPNITWEVAKTANFGFDLTLWNNLLSVTFDYFTQKRSNILATKQLSIPSTFGFTALPTQNIGKVDNHGFEFIISHINKIGKVGYNVTGNMSFARNNIVFIDEVPNTFRYQDQTGHPIGSQLVYNTIGIFKDQAEIDAYPHLSNAKPGDVIIEDYNADNAINSYDQYREERSTLPEIVFGLDLGVDYKNFDCSFFFQGQANAVIYPGITTLGSSSSNSFAIRAEDRWTLENTDGKMPRSGANFPRNSSLNRYNAAFLRLKNVEFGYTLPKSLVSRLGIQNMRAYFNAYNVFTISELSFMDPEADPTKNDMNNYPQLRTFNVGFNITF